MVVVIDGIKYACQNCIKGHRVAHCQHTDRPLQPLQRKGRPVSQCQHCRKYRVENKSHVKCTCAISSVPNPINGCMCHIVERCTCVASARQDTNSESDTAYSLDMASTLRNSGINNPEMNDQAVVVDEDIWNAVMSDIDSICSPSSQSKF